MEDGLMETQPRKRVKHDAVVDQPRGSRSGADAMWGLGQAEPGWHPGPGCSDQGGRRKKGGGARMDGTWAQTPMAPGQRLDWVGETVIRK